MEKGADYSFRTRPGEIRRGTVIDRLSGKTSKQDVGYRPAKEGEKESCAECIYFTQPGQDTSSCVRVAGVVYAEDTCDIFASRPIEGSPAKPETHQITINIRK